MPQAQDYPALLQDMLRAVQRISQQNWCSATGGNFSARVDEERLLMTRSGRDKNTLREQDWMLCDRDGLAMNADDRPSDEAALHARLYQLDDNIRVVLHSHSVTATVLSRQRSSKAIRIQGFEMQKSLQGQVNPDDPVILPVLENNQDISRLADELETLWRGGRVLCPGVLVRGHGLYAWGNSVAAALRHLEGWEFLLECLWRERLLQGNQE
ncbi:MAG: methylthioribulose 1-phosphate dehydratase [Oceanococcus sp.]